MRERVAKPEDPAAEADTAKPVAAATGPNVVQTKLVVGAANDPHEREADRAADEAMAWIRGDGTDRAQPPIVPPTTTRIRPMPIRRQPEANADEIDPDGEIDDFVAGPEADEADSDADEPPDDESVQRAAAAGEPPPQQSKIGMRGGPVDAATAATITSARGRGSPLDSKVRPAMEGAFGADFGRVRVHTGPTSDELNRSLSARAFTVGSDVFFAKNQYKPKSLDGQKTLAHELAHVVQQGGTSDGSLGRVAAIWREFKPAVVTSNAHLRDAGVWGTFKGPKIDRGSHILVDIDPAHAKIQKRIRPDVTWRPAVNAPALNDPPDQHVDYADNRKGYIRSGRVAVWGRSLKPTYESHVRRILKAGEDRHASLAGKLVKDEHVDFLVGKALRYDNWNGANASLDGFFSGFSTKEDKFDRIQEGAEYVADSLEHWRKWLHPGKPNLVFIDDVEFKKSDLHERGLGVIKVKFIKPLGGAAKFAEQTDITAMIKPEDKSLEEALLGDAPTSAANKINELLGLDNDHMLSTIKMCSTTTHGSLVELVKGISAEDLTKANGATPIEPVFHETLVFVFLTGMDDLHKENVFWDDGRPYLIDADNVMSHNQMLNVDQAKTPQSGFGSDYDADEAQKNKTAIEENDYQAIGSELLEAMVKDEGIVKLQIIDAIKEAIAGKKGRVVPIRTNRWGTLLSQYAKLDDKDGFLDFYSTRKQIVREELGFDSVIGPGLAGVTGINRDVPFYNQAAEKAEIKKDFDAGVIPFYEYEFSTGFVTHNGTKIFHGLTLDRAMDIMLEKFDPNETAKRRKAIIDEQF